AQFPPGAEKTASQLYSAKTCAWGANCFAWCVKTVTKLVFCFNFKANSNNLYLAFKLMAMPTSHQPSYFHARFHHSSSDPGVYLSVLPKNCLPQIALGCLGQSTSYTVPSSNLGF
ncbi:hypothetical protein L195_g060783, partial [Trifolium pratense]